MSEVVCDYLNATVPLAESGGLVDELRIYLAQCGAVVDQEGLWRFEGGTVRIGERGRVLTLGISGLALAGLREMGALPEFLAILADWPHRITSMDAAWDVHQDAAPVVQRLYQEANEGQHRLTRKALGHDQVLAFFSKDDRGKDTGTVYLGKKTAEVRCRVYDKRWERLSKGFDDPGPLVRYELTVTGKMGPTLRDVVEPAAMFWHFVGRSLLESPITSVHQWTGHGEGFNLPPRPETLPAQALAKRLEDNAELKELVWLAVQAGDVEVRRIVRHVQDLAAREVSDTAPDQAETSSC